MTTTTRPRIAALNQHHHRRRGAAIAAAVLTPLLVWTIAVPVLGVDLAVAPGSGDDPARTVGPVLVAAVSLLAALLGWALLAVLEQHTHRARTLWVGAAGAVLLVSLAGPLTSANTPSAALTLVAMHVGVAAVLIPLLAATSETLHV